MVQRRVVHRLFYLKPTKSMFAIFAYCLAYAAQKVGVLIHEFIVMSNHYHIVLSDPNGQLPKFQQILNSFVARATNASHRRVGTFWENESFTAPELPEDADVVDKCVYVLANPCTADLVERAREWPGLSSWKLDYGNSIVTTRPSFFGEDMPATLELEIVRPPVMPELSDQQLRAEIRRRTIEREQKLMVERKAAGRTVMGVEAVLRQSIDDRPRTRDERFGTRPTVSTRSVWAREACLQRNADWLCRYRDALTRYVQGIRDALFPFGTYLMKVRFSVCCSGP
jgi:REP element-mobilizing transposase RayT